DLVLDRIVHEVAGGGVPEAISSDGQRYLTVRSDDGGFSAIARLREAATGRELVQFVGHSNTLIAGALAPNGELAATVGSDLALRVWDAKSGRELWWKAVAETQPPPQAVAFSADSRHVIATQGESAWRWEATSGKDAGRYVGHGATVVRARF